MSVPLPGATPARVVDGSAIAPKLASVSSAERAASAAEDRAARDARAGAHAPRLGVINGLRGCAILAVIYHHSFYLFLTPLGGRAVDVGPFTVPLHSLFTNGWLGVNLFFILSGFVLMLPYASGDRTMSSGKDLKAYYGRRARRLLPLYYFALLVSIFLKGQTDFVSLDFVRDIWAMGTFTFVFEHATFMPKYNLILWSIAVEVWFSVVFPLIVVAWRRIGAWPVALVVLALSLCVRLYAIAFYETGVLHYVKDGIAGRLDDFVVGMALAVLYVKQPLRSRSASAALVLAGFLLLNVCALSWDNVQLGNVNQLFSGLFNNLAQVAFGLMIVGLLGAPPRWLRRLFVLWPLQLAGAMSYSLYIWHTAGVYSSTRSAPIYDIPAYLLISAVIAAMTYCYIEFPKKSARELFFGFGR
jgi:peptidoglycan/LPS O-acetylase OafA/YrhL